MQDQAVRLPRASRSTARTLVTIAAMIAACLPIPGISSIAAAHAGGTTWDVPGDFATIQAAIDAASDGDTILVDANPIPPGVYEETIDLLGKAITVRSVNGRHEIRPADLTRPALQAVSNEDLDSVIEGFRLRQPSNASNAGPAVLVDLAGPLLLDCVIESAAPNRPAIELIGANPTIRECEVSSSGQDAVRAVASGLRIEDSMVTAADDGIVIENLSLAFIDRVAIEGCGDRGLTANGSSQVFVTDTTISSSGNEGMNISGATVELLSCRIEDSAVRGIYCLNSASLTMLDTDLVGNGQLTGVVGGGIRVEGTQSLVIRGGTIAKNRAQRGGGVYNEDSSSVLIDGTTFRDNVALLDGGGIWTVGGFTTGEITLTNLVIDECDADRGGGVYISGSFNGRLDLLESTILQCTATFGSALYSGPSSSGQRLRNLRILGCIAGVSGGFFLDGADPDIANVVFSGNEAASFGGAIFARGDAHPRFDNCTFTNNSAASGAVIEIFDTTSSATFENSILWNNPAVDGGFGIDGPGTATVAYSIVEGGYDGEGNLDLDPAFANPIGADGIPGTDDDDLRLAPGSPAIDSGLGTLLPADTTDLDGDGDTTEPLPLDLDGFARVVDGDGDGVAILDRGAHELPQSGRSCPGDITNDGLVGFLDLIEVITAWGPCPTACPADLDSDGDVGFPDLTVILVQWGPC